MRDEKFESALLELEQALILLNEAKARVNLEEEKQTLIYAEATLYGMLGTVYERLGRSKDERLQRERVGLVVSDFKNRGKPESSVVQSQPSSPKPQPSSSSGSSSSSAPSSPILKLDDRQGSVDSPALRPQGRAEVSKPRRKGLFSATSALGDSPLVLHRSLRPMTLSKKLLAAGVVLGDLPKDMINVVQGLGGGVFRVVYRNADTAANVAKGLWRLTRTKDGFLTTGVSGSDGYKDVAGLEEVAGIGAPWWAQAASAVSGAVGRVCQQVQFQNLVRALDSALDMLELSGTIELVAKLDSGIQLCQTFLQRLPSMNKNKQTLDNELIHLRHEASKIISKADLWLRQTKLQMDSSTNLSADDQKQLVHRLQVLWKIWIESKKLKLFVSYLEAYTERLYGANPDRLQQLVSEYEIHVDNLSEAGQLLKELRSSVQRLCAPSDSLPGKIESAWNSWQQQKEPAFSGWNAWESDQREHLSELLLGAKEDAHLLDGSSSSSSSSSYAVSGSSSSNQDEIELPEEGLYLHYDPETGKSTLFYKGDTNEDESNE
jgi:hypothetical protein